MMREILKPLLFALAIAAAICYAVSKLL